MSNLVVETQGLRKLYRTDSLEAWALRGVDLQVEQGEFVVVAGPSGSGKTTLLNLIGCLDVPTDGYVWIEGKRVTELDAGQLAELRARQIGFIFQFFNLLPILTAQENVELPLRIIGVAAVEAKRRAEELLRAVGLQDKLTRRPMALSGGEQQRVAICRALANRPALLLADEPTGNLDSVTGMQIVELLARLNHELNQTIICVTHSHEIAERAGRLLLLRDGLIEKEIKR